MKNGLNRYIEYISGDNQQWRAYLKDLSPDWGGLTDPVFHHEGPGGQAHDDSWINYKAQDGQYWWAVCHSHSGPFTELNFTFDHCRKQNNDPPDHTDSIIGFIGWDGLPWVASVNPGLPSFIQFRAEQKHL